MTGVMLALAVACAVSVGCGKRGSPLTPFVRVPAAPGPITARRSGDAVYITVAIPDLNVDTFGPADIARVEVYGHTGLTPPPVARFLEVATLVATIPVAPPAPAVRPGVPAAKPLPGTSPVTVAGALQGTAVSVRDTLEPDELVPRTLPPLPGRAALPALTTAAAPAPAPAGPPRRFYMAIAFNARGRPGPRSAITEMPLTISPDPVTEIRVTYTADAVSVRWEPSGGLLGFMLDRALPIETPPFDDPAARVPAVASPLPVRPAGPTRYNVYRDIAPDPLLLPEAPVLRAPWHVPAAVPLTPQPITAVEFSEPVLLDERHRCYQIRSVRGEAALLVEGPAADRVCVVPVDVFPPAVPTGVSALAADGIISLIWEPNIEVDLGGYLVLRGEAGGATLLPLTDTPIAETRFTDRAVTPGVRYVYSVMAVDTRVPLPNVSAGSVRVEETAR